MNMTNSVLRIEHDRGYNFMKGDQVNTLQR